MNGPEYRSRISACILLLCRYLISCTFHLCWYLELSSNPESAQCPLDGILTLVSPHIMSSFFFFQNTLPFLLHVVMYLLSFRTIHHLHRLGADRCNLSRISPNPLHFCKSMDLEPNPYAEKFRSLVFYFRVKKTKDQGHSFLYFSSPPPLLYIQLRAVSDDC